jgi:hypothetical protein
LKCKTFSLARLLHTHRQSSEVAHLAVEVILKRAERYMPDHKLGNFLVNAAELISGGQEGICSMFLFFCPSSIA